NMAGDGESLESWLNKATSSANRQEDWEYIMGFCDQINKELEGPQIATRLLAYKIQSPQEWEAMQTLTVLEACMKNCGGRFHNEVGKFRFLNELIKVVSPKYFGDRISEKVKNKVIEILYSWTVSLPDEAKISEAYQMLKKQGIVSVNPELPHDNTLIPSPSLRPKNPVFENEEKSRRLAELLKSKKPEDLQEANRIIKNMVKEDDVRAQKVTKTNRTLDEVDHRVKLLNEMLNHFSEEVSTDGDKDIIRELYGDCDKLRQTVFKLATETEDNDNNLGNILQASDDLSRVINSYKRIVEGQIINGEKEEHLTRIFLIISLFFFLSSTDLSTTGMLDVAGFLGAASTSSSPMPHLLGGMPAGPLVLPPAKSQADDSPLLRSLSPVLTPSQPSPGKGQEISLSSVKVSLEAIKPSESLCPVTAYDKYGIRVLLHFASDCPPDRPDVLVMVASMLNTAPLPVSHIVLQAAVPKSMRLRLQPPSGTELAAFNPILPPAAITQVILLANPLKEKVRMRYKLAFTLGEQPCSEIGEVEQFPPAEKWGAL
uniref:Golgi associated, gamma adaptin ear containing, ARF binding protein 3a n=1 Tax=Gadus morhua TaxID=8049 RepID=A0A8C4Z2A2_GADMO